MAQNNLYMEDDDLRLYVDVQPLFIDELENSKNSAAASALQAAQSEEAARGWKNDIEDYKTGLELFYAQATDGITNSYNTSISGLSAAKSLAINDLNTQKNSIQSSLNSSLNAAISSIRTNGQSYVNQAHDYAQEAQRTVDNRVSTDHLNQSKGLLTGSVSSDEEVLNDIRRYAHSTFDRSKFTVSGSPTITDDGILTATAYTQRVSTGVVLDGSKDWTIKLRFRDNHTSSSGANPCFIGFNGDDNSNQIIVNNINGTNFVLQWVIGGSFGRISSVITSGVFHNFVVSYTASTGTYKITCDGTEIFSNTSTAYSCSNPIIFGGVPWMSPNADWDLKYVEIINDGKILFSGNKTGIDTIKPDDYTVVGTPTISADGIASGFSSSNYIQKSIDFTSAKKIDIHIKANLNNLSTLQVISSYGGSAFWGGIYGGNAFYFIDNTFSIPGVGIYDLILSADITNKLASVSYKKEGDANYTTTTPTIISDTVISALSTVKNMTIGIHGSLYPFLNEIDLNSFKIYVDGDLVYQPCLKIPYTQSKTGSKVADSIYRERVKDMYEQFGYAPYYTLGSSDFTLPMGDIYGMIEKLRELIIQRTSQGS